MLSLGTLPYVVLDDEARNRAPGFLSDRISMLVDIRTLRRKACDYRTPFGWCSAVGVGVALAFTPLVTRDLSCCSCWRVAHLCLSKVLQLYITQIY